MAHVPRTAPGQEGEGPGNQVANEKEEDGLGEKQAERSQQKPPYSYAQLIVQALLASKDRRQTLSNIYGFISEKYPYYKLEDKGWKVQGEEHFSVTVS